MKALPNLLSSLRLALAIALPFAPERWWFAMILGAGLSDWVDGFLARRLKAASWIGGVLDAVADKAFVLSALITLTAHGMLAIWQILLLLVRDFAVLAMSVYNALTGAWRDLRKVPSRLPGRATTVGIFVFLLAVVLWPEATGAHLALFAIAVLLNVAAAVDYSVRFYHQKREKLYPVPHVASRSETDLAGDRVDR